MTKRLTFQTTLNFTTNRGSRFQNILTQVSFIIQSAEPDVGIMTPYAEDICLENSSGRFCGQATESLSTAQQDQIQEEAMKAADLEAEADQIFREDYLDSQVAERKLEQQAEDEGVSYV